MFTGIIEEVGTIRNVANLGGGRRLTIEAAFAPELRIDQSVSVNGACQTVVALEGRTFEVVAVEETLRKTTLGTFQPGQPVNLERAMLPTSRLDGHLVQGHVDATATVVGVEVLDTSRLYRIRFDARFASYVIPVGSIALDGISLTVARLEDPELTVAIIPHTYTHTNAHTWHAGTTVNIEFDLIGKYVGRWLEQRSTDTPAPPRLDEAWLREKGF